MLVRGIPDDPMSLKVAKKDQQGFLNPFYPNVPFLYLLKTSKTQKISDVCRAIAMEHWAKMGQFRNTFENYFFSKSYSQFLVAFTFIKDVIRIS